MSRRASRLSNVFTDLGWSFVILTGLCLAGAGGLVVLHLSGVR